MFRNLLLALLLLQIRQISAGKQTRELSFLHQKNAVICILDLLSLTQLLYPSQQII